jgi:hypothetical protein
MPKGLMGLVEMLRWTGRLSGLWLGHCGLEQEKGRHTLQTGLDHVERVHGKRGDGAGRQASNGLDQRGREARMVFVHKGGGGVDDVVLIARCFGKQQ